MSHQDSNLDRQYQKLQCYHYTMRQSLFALWVVVFSSREAFPSKAMQRYYIFSNLPNNLRKKCVFISFYFSGYLTSGFNILVYNILFFIFFYFLPSVLKRAMCIVTAVEMQISRIFNQIGLTRYTEIPIVSHIVVIITYFACKGIALCSI